MRLFEMQINDYLIEEVMKTLNQFPVQDLKVVEKTSMLTPLYIDDGHIETISYKEQMEIANEINDPQCYIVDHSEFVEI